MTQVPPRELIISKTWRHIIGLFPHFTRLTLAIPGSFTRWAQGFLSRLLDVETLALLFIAFIMLAFLLLFPIGTLIRLASEGPSNDAIYDFLVKLHELISREFAKKDSNSIFWWGIATLAGIALLPWLARLYVAIVFGLGHLAVVSVVHIITGYKIGEAFEAAPPRSTGSLSLPSTGASSRPAALEEFQAYVRDARQASCLL